MDYIQQQFLKFSCFLPRLYQFSMKDKKRVEEKEEKLDKSPYNHVFFD